VKSRWRNFRGGFLVDDVIIALREAHNLNRCTAPDTVWFYFVRIGCKKPVRRLPKNFRINYG